jgi:Rod binding domain-containing protein
MIVLNIPHTENGIRLPSEAHLSQRAQEFEQIFIADMLRQTGLHRPPSSINGGDGEEVFSSLLIHEHARNFASRGGIGLAEHLVRGMVRKT